jgi:hypothetical protein
VLYCLSHSSSPALDNSFAPIQLLLLLRTEPDTAFEMCLVPQETYNDLSLEPVPHEFHMRER